MAQFIARVQLSLEISGNYTRLRDALLNIGFTKRVRSKEGVEYRLPNGNYRVESNKSLDEVTTAVAQIARSIDRNSQIFVCEVKENGMSWNGLQRC